MMNSMPLQRTVVAEGGHGGHIEYVVSLRCSPGALHYGVSAFEGMKAH